MIEITLHYAGKHVDLLVPNQVTFDRLAQLVHDGFAAKNTSLPEDFSLLIDDKALSFSGDDVIASFGIGNGDRLRVEA